MQQRFGTRSISIQELADWHDRGELDLAPKFQRRDVWNLKARSYLMDTIVRGKPVPKIYMRQDTNPKTRRTIREIVDGQQRLNTVFLFIGNSFQISATHNSEYGGKYFQDLDDETQREVLKYEFTVDLLQDMADRDVYDVFARLNTYQMTLNYQELRHSKYFGEFKTAVYDVSNEFTPFWQANHIFGDKQLLRMAEAEFVSELFIAMVDGIREKTKRSIDSYYSEYDEKFPRRRKLEDYCRQVIDHIGGIMGDEFSSSNFSSTRLLYPLFCAVYHMQYGLPKLTLPRKRIKASDYLRIRFELGKADEVIESQKLARQTAKELTEEDADFDRQQVSHGVLVSNADEEFPEADADVLEDIEPVRLSSVDRKFFTAYDEHWVHAENRRILTDYVGKLILRTL